ncbi:hypothetical protein D3C81_574880 [compost metagenome]
MRLRQAVLPVQGAGRARRCRLLGQQLLVNAGLLPVPCLVVLAEHAQVHRYNLMCERWRQQRHATFQHQRGHLMPGHLQDRRLHQFERHAGGDVEDLPLMGQIVAAIAVTRVDAQLLFTAQYQHRGAGHHQWPQGFEFGFGQRVERMVGLDCRQYPQRVAFGVMQQCRAGHRQVGDAPGVHQVAEIDDALQLPLALLIARPDGVIIGDVQMYRLHRQLVEQRLQTFPGLLCGGTYPRLLRAFGQHRQQVSDQCLGVPWVPLQGSFEPRVGEVGQGQVDSCTKTAQLSHQARLHVLDTGQRLTFYIVEQAHAQALTVHVHRQQLLAGTCCQHRRYRHSLVMQIAQGSMLGLELRNGIVAMADLQHIAPAGGVQAKIQVLLATQRLQ